MKVDVSFKYLEESEFIHTVIEHNLEKIKRRVKMFKRDDPVHISVHIEKNPHKEQFFCRSHIYLPSSKVIAAGEKGTKATVAINKAFAGLARQLNKEKTKWQAKRRKCTRLGIGVQEAEPDNFS